MLDQRRSSYPSDLTESEWSYIQDLIPKAKTGGRPREYDDRRIISAILYLNRSGVQWRALPKDFPPWQSVYRYFSMYSKMQVWEKILNRLHRLVRSKNNHLHPTHPRLIIIDSQSTKAQYGESRGYDGFKKVRGRKRHILVDSLGIPYAILITEASAHDAASAILLLDKLKAKRAVSLRAIENLLVDGSYKHRAFFEHAMSVHGLTPTLRIARVTYIKGKREGRELQNSSLKPLRWIVERTFAWLINFRRLTRDFEKKISHSEAMIEIAMITLLLHRLTPT